MPSIALALIVPFLGGCGSEDEFAATGPARSLTGLDLTEHAPDQLLAQPGIFQADEEWRRSWGTGWDRRLSTTAAGVSFRWTDGDVAEMQLPALESEDREVVVNVEARVEGAPVSVEARLNGVTLGRRAVDEVPATLRFPAPRTHWVRGANLLELAIDRTAETWRSQEDGGRAWRGVGVSAVDYAEHRSATWSAGEGFTLAAGTSAVYALERDVASGGKLIGRGHSSGSGRLEFVAQGRTGGDFDGRDVGEPVAVEFSAPGPFEFTLAPEWSDAERDVALRATWHGSGEAHLEQLAVQRNAARLPPIVFISIDTLAARSLSLYGYGRETTPRLDAFAKQCVVFEDCRANTSWTAPSYISQFTGLLPAANRVVADESGGSLSLWDKRLVAPDRWTLAQALRARGYRTGGVVANTWLALTRGIARGFDHFDDEPSEHALTETDWAAPVVFERALAWLDEDSNRPPFAFVQLLDVHAPYLPGSEWRGRFGSDVLSDVSPLPVVSGRAQVARSLRRAQALALGPEAGEASQVDGARMRAAYDENLAEFDADFGVFLDELQRRPWFDEAIILISADHGEAMEEPRFVFDHVFPAEDVLRVPLIVRLPRGERRGTRIDVPVQLVDLYPTLIEAAGLDPSDRGLGGRSLWSVLHGRPSDIADDRASLVHDAGYGSRAVVDGRWKLVEFPIVGLPVPTMLSIQGAYDRWAAFDPATARRAERVGIQSDFIARLWIDYDDPLLALPGLEPLIASLSRFYASSPGVVHELYDLERDPLALRDVSADHPQRVTELAAVLAESRARLESLRPSASADDGGGADAEALDRLRALGYLGDE